MIKLNEEYSINSGQGTIVFTEGNKGTVNAEYEIQGNKGKGKINGTLQNNVLTGTFHVDAAAGLIQFTFIENGFDAKWKQGIEPGPMKGKWTGSLNSQSDNNQSINEKTSLSPEQLKWIEEGSWDYEKVPKDWLESKEFMLAAVTNYGRDLEYASDKLKDDKEIVLAAVVNGRSALEFASDKLKDAKEIVLAAVTNDGKGLQYASDKLKDDKEIVLAAVADYVRALEFASDKLKDDGEIMLVAVKKDGSALKYASNNLKNNREIVLEAIKNEPNAIEFASDQLNGDPAIVLTAMSQDSYALYYVRSEVILKELAENSSVGGTKINFKVRDLVSAVENLIVKNLFDENGDYNTTICNDWFEFNQIIYQNQTMDGDALLSIAQVQFNEYRPSSRDDVRDVKEYTRDLLIEAIELNDESLADILCYGLSPQEYVDYSDLAEKACELLWNKSEKSYADALMVIVTDEDEFELTAGISEEFAKKIIKEAREIDSGEEEDKENFENFVSEAGLD
jgi:hypothetical protein